MNRLLSPAHSNFFALAGTGVIGGFLSGLFGVGGGIIMVPLLVMWLGFDQRRAAATSLMAIIPASIAGTIGYGIGGQVDIVAAVAIAAGAIIGAPVGSSLLRRLPLWALRWIFILMLIIEAARLIFVTEVGASSFVLNPWSIIELVGLGLLMGVASGLLGIGGGVIAVPVLISVLGFAPLLAKGTSLLVMIPTAVVGSIANRRAGVGVLRDGVIVGIAAVVASLGGAALSFTLPEQVSTQLFGLLLVLVAGQMIYKALGAKNDR